MSNNHREAAQAALNRRDFAAANVYALLNLADEQHLANMIAACQARTLPASERRTTKRRIADQILFGGV